MSDVRRLQELIRQTPRVMTVLAAVRACDPPDWYVGAGLLRSLVWDHLHGYDEPTAVSDVDVVCFDAQDPDDVRAQGSQAALRRRRPDLAWDVTNQANVHRWYPTTIAPLRSSLEGLATWPETATAVGVRLTSGDDLLIAAPCGLDDLFGMVVRRNPCRVDLATYRQRLATKQFTAKWPRLQVIGG